MTAPSRERSKIRKQTPLAVGVVLSVACAAVASGSGNGNGKAMHVAPGGRATMSPLGIHESAVITESEHRENGTQAALAK